MKKKAKKNHIFSKNTLDKKRKITYSTDMKPQNRKEASMRINIELPDAWGPVIDQEAAKDGHSNRSAVVRKCVSVFFARDAAYTRIRSKKGKMPDG